MSAGRRNPRRAGARPRRLLRAAAGASLTLLAGCSAGAAGATASSPPPAGTPSTAAAHVDAPGTTVFAAAERRPVPDVAGRTLDGTALRLRDVAGRGVVVVNVWASWCTSCRAESAVLAAASHESADVRFVGIDEADSAPAARRFVAASGTTYPQLVDPDGVLLAKLPLLPSTGIPSTLVLDRHGRMAARVIGPVTGPGLDRVVAAVAREP